ncbi:MAG: transposase [Candidatus Lindowbacteria bacterium]|nr:transposase [Candidatus Lindowbacteria bacterium]
MGMKRKSYDTEFKEEAVKLLLRSGKKIGDVAGIIGVDRSTLGRWQDAYLQEAEGEPVSPKRVNGSVSELEQEIGQLKRRVADIAEERDILKKAIGIFSKKSSSDFGS